jgi:hypothetical protein
MAGQLPSAGSMGETARVMHRYLKNRGNTLMKTLAAEQFSEDSEALSLESC